MVSYRCHVEEVSGVNKRPKSWLAAAVSLGAVIALGAVLVWIPRGDDSLPAGVDLGDCDSPQRHTFTVSASLTATEAVPTATAPGVAADGTQVAMPQVVLSTPFFPGPDDDVQTGSSVTVSVRQCAGISMTFALAPTGVVVDGQETNQAQNAVASSVGVQEQRLHAGTAKVYVSNPSWLPCEDGGACASWTGWYFTLESAGRGSTVFHAPVRWGPENASVLDSHGQLEVKIAVDTSA